MFGLFAFSIAKASVLLLDFQSDESPKEALVATEAVRQGLNSRTDLSGVLGMEEFALKVPIPKSCSEECLQTMSAEYGVETIIKGVVDVENRIWAQITFIDVTTQERQQQELVASEFSELLEHLRAESLKWRFTGGWELEQQPIPTTSSTAEDFVFAFEKEHTEDVPHENRWLAFLGRTQPVTHHRSHYEMRLIQPGTFVMGTPQNEVPNQHHEHQHLVQISYPFYIGVTEFDLRSWNALYDRPYSGPSLPIDSVGKREAMILANDISQNAGLELCYRSSKEGLNFVGVQCTGYRLPTEAEWEFAARAGQYQTYVGGDLVDPIGWYQDNTHQLQSIGRKLPNALGLYDMSGNLCEWVYDDWKSYPKGKGWSIDPVVQEERQTPENLGVCRGGSWQDGKIHLRAAARRKVESIPNEVLGIRFVRTVLEDKQ